MKPSLQLRMSQSLAMTPQLQQAIRLLQLSTLELQQEIQEALDSNPLLEQEDPNTTQPNGAESSDEHNLDNNDTVTDASQIEVSDALASEAMPDELPNDSNWDDVYTPQIQTHGSAGGGIDGLDQVYQGETSEGLYEHLMWQMELTPFTDTDRAIAVAIIDGIDDHGYLHQTCEDILSSVNSDHQELSDSSSSEEQIELDEIEAVLKRIQHFDPIGVAARSLQECLLIQLQHLPKNTPWLTECQQIIQSHMDLLGNRDYRQLSRKTKLKEPQLKEIMQLIQSLEPRPGNVIDQTEGLYVIPDVLVKKKNNQWVVELNPDIVPRLKVNNEYSNLSTGNRNSSDGQFIRTHVQEAKWFIKSLESRNETLLKVTKSIVQRQVDFFEYGDEAMKPMVLNDIAEEVEMHESTISRVTTQKFMHTPRGIFELKFFFSSHVSTDNGGECSSTAIRALIKKLVAAENAIKPLSDSKIADLLADQGIKVARRTIAKYREALSIPPSNQRKSLL
ncbi:DNA-directed RNA polymerase subunit N [Moritella viscosa]|uniref:RNA polymerase factor sigma-54 n=1 Tax=Moritella viscosa TaxID=80854 RepID=UPI0005092773|nr:RNA polymerase factor sigma-54 [Moritella viscosa]CED62096.1 RNA polymerase sigma-54 factor (sigma-N) [Moritella viscosa]SGY97125.1 DNA-directed RNA polymerase subunit N [Moritella viscosa]SHO08256.1 DNA-directed RNA polymerase subunit N [Moritella viscosa]